jgi:hypothetical protein
MASVSASHENLSSAHWNTAGSLHLMATDLCSPWDHAGPCTLPLSGYKICPLQALTSLHPVVLASFRYLWPLIFHHLPVTHLLELSPLHVGSLLNTPLHFFLVFFLDQQKRTFPGLMNSCSCFLLVCLVVVWEPSGFILSHVDPMGS